MTGSLPTTVTASPCQVLSLPLCQHCWRRWPVACANPAHEDSRMRWEGGRELEMTCTLCCHGFCPGTGVGQPSPTLLRPPLTQASCSGNRELEGDSQTGASGRLGREGPATCLPWRQSLPGSPSPRGRGTPGWAKGGCRDPVPPSTASPSALQAQAPSKPGSPRAGGRGSATARATRGFPRSHEVGRLWTGPGAELRPEPWSPLRGKGWVPAVHPVAHGTLLMEQVSLGGHS